MICFNFVLYQQQLAYYTFGHITVGSGVWLSAHVDKGGRLLHVFLSIRSSLVALVPE